MSGLTLLSNFILVHELPPFLPTFLLNDKLEKLNGEKRELPKDLKENDHIEKEEVKQKDGHVEDKQNVSFRRKVGRKGGNSCTRMKLDNRVKPDITGSGVRVEPDTSHVTNIITVRVIYS
jgi:hypothetical protein